MAPVKSVIFNQMAIFARPQVPEAQRPIVTGGVERAAIRRQRQSMHFALVSGQPAEFASASCIPSIDRPVLGSSENSPTIAGEGQGGDAAAMAPHRQAIGSRFGV